jgi:hypothetical protein
MARENPSTSWAWAEGPGVIAKPFTVGVLRATINEALAVRARF